MKRPILHVLFWFIYLIQDTILHYSWMKPLINNVSEGEQVWMAIQTAFLVLPPKLFIVYYFLRFGVKKLLNSRKNWFGISIEMLLVLTISIAWFRITFHYVVNPHIYLQNVEVPLFNIRNVLISILEVGYITGIAIAFKLLRLQTSSREREQNLVKEKLQAELKFLKNQTNPHFLFNTLNNIHVLARKKSDRAPEAIMKLSDLLSFMLYETAKETISLDEEIKFLENYIDLEKIRYTEKVTVSITKDIDNGSQQIAPLILLPLVENAFKHGVGESRFSSYINLDVKLKDGHLHYSIENSMENGQAKKLGTSIGLSNTRRQLELMYKEQELSVESTENVFIVNVDINLNSYGKI